MQVKDRRRAKEKNRQGVESEGDGGKEGVRRGEGGWKEKRRGWVVYKQPTDAHGTGKWRVVKVSGEERNGTRWMDGRRTGSEMEAMQHFTVPYDW